MDSLGPTQESFRRIYEATYQHLFAYAQRRVGESDADDVVAETFTVAWRKVDCIPSGDMTLPWLYGVARRVIYQRYRTSRRRQRLLARLGGLRHDERGAMEGDQVEDRQLVRDALALLRESDQEILRLSEWEDLSAPQLAAVLGCSANA